MKLFSSAKETLFFLYLKINSHEFVLLLSFWSFVNSNSCARTKNIIYTISMTPTKQAMWTVKAKLQLQLWSHPPCITNFSTMWANPKKSTSLVDASMFHGAVWIVEENGIHLLWNFSYSFWLYLLKIENLKHKTSHIWFPIHSVRKTVNGLLNSSCSGVSQPSIVLKCILNLLRVRNKVMQMFISQVPPTEFVHQQSPVPLL